MALNGTLVTLNDGRQIPWLGFGTGTALYKQDAANLVKQAIATGVTHLDGAQVYENEDSLGEGIKASGKPRSELFVTTKLFKLNPGETVKESLEKSLKRLQLDYVDLFLIHTPLPAAEEGKILDIWKGFEEVQAAGLAKSIGVSNFRVEDLQTVLKGGTVVPAVNQIELHPYVWKAAKPIHNFGTAHGIRTVSYGGLTPIVRAAGGPLDTVLKSISARLAKTRGAPVTPGQVLTKWLLQKDAVVVTTSSKQSRIQEFLDSENIPDLEEEEINAIEEAGSKLHKRAFMHRVFGEQP